MDWLSVTILRRVWGVTLACCVIWRNACRQHSDSAMVLSIVAFPCTGASMVRSRAWTRPPILNSLRVRDTLRIFVRLIPRTAAWEWSSSCSLCSQAWRSVLKTFVMLGVISISSGLYPALIAGACGSPAERSLSLIHI